MSTSKNNCPVPNCPKPNCPKPECPKLECPKPNCPKLECPKLECPIYSLPVISEIKCPNINQEYSNIWKYLFIISLLVLVVFIFFSNINNKSRIENLSKLSD